MSTSDMLLAEGFRAARAPVRALLRPSQIRSRTLVVLRWLAIVGQTVSILFVAFVLDFPVPLVPSLAVIGASAIFNIAVGFRFASSRRLSDLEAGLSLAFDVLQLAALLALTGGVLNPFTLLFLAPATIAATTLSLRATLILAALTVLCITALSLLHLPLPWRGEEPFSVPRLYLAGTWLALVFGLTFTVGYAWRISAEARRMSRALAATQFVLAREQKLSALGGLAAAAAHELGTPLGTIALAARELEREMDPAAPGLEDARLIRGQAERCREILGRLSGHSGEEDSPYARLKLGTLVDEVADPHRGFGVEIDVRLSGPGRDPEVWRLPEVLYGLGNIVENAVDFARERVEIEAQWDETRIEVLVLDDGPGFSPEVIERLGEPYVSTRARPGQTAVDPPYHDPEGHEGMGLGFFIAKTLIERTGGEVSYENRSAGAARTGGAGVRITWRRGLVEPGSALRDR